MDHENPTASDRVKRPGADRVGLWNSVKARWGLLAAGIGLCVLAVTMWFSMDENVRSVKLPDGSVLTFHGVTYGTNLFAAHQKAAARIFLNLPRPLKVLINREKIEVVPPIEMRGFPKRPTIEPRLAMGFTVSQLNQEVVARGGFRPNLFFRLYDNSADATDCQSTWSPHNQHYDISMFLTPNSLCAEDELLLKVFQLLPNGYIPNLSSPVAAFTFKNPIPKDQREKLSGASGVAP